MKNYSKEEAVELFSKEEVVELFNEFMDLPLSPNIYKKTQEFLKEKGLIESFEVGKWYKSNLGHLYCIKSINYERIEYYGFSIYRTNRIQWNDCSMNINSPAAKSLILATPKEVEEALIKEAKKRGFKEGCKIIGWDSDKTKTKISGDNYVYYEHEFFDKKTEDEWFCANTLYLGDCQIFAEGKWAEIVEEKKECDFCNFMFYSKVGKGSTITLNGETYIKK